MTIKMYIRLFACLFVFTMIISGCSDNPKCDCSNYQNNTSGTPIINAVTPITSSIGYPVVITGSNFGTIPSTSTITFNGTMANTYRNWSDTMITVLVPEGAMTGKVFINVNGKLSNGVDFTVQTIQMVTIPAGTFQRGNTGGFTGASIDELPIHTVTISRNFLMSKYEITQKLYKSVMGKNPSYFIGDSLPVEQINWYDAVEFCNKLSIMEGLDTCYRGSITGVICDWNANGYRLPTDAEWEYACKARTNTDFYNGSITNPSCSPLDLNLDNIGWYCGNSDNTTHPVGLKQANNFGLYDMSGNVREWCWDWYSNFSSSALTDPVGPTSGSLRVFRGGCFDFDAQYNRSSDRCNYFPNQKDRNLGFRVVSVKY